MSLKRVATKSTTPHPQVIDSEEEQNPPPADPQSAGDQNPTAPTDPETDIDHAQIVGQLMAAIEKEIGGKGTGEPTQTHPAPLVSIFPLNLLIFVGFLLLFLILNRCRLYEFCFK